MGNVSVGQRALKLLAFKVGCIKKKTLPPSRSPSQTTWTKGLRSFHIGNIGSLGQRAARLLAVKVGGLKKSLHFRPLQPKCVQACLAHSQ